eukprot:TRINITY_DN1512_c1_g1_i5.p2 TRINITY_DN1512_c1_g1~~TRINITY_DN1512_c1_g1_i5.p2  ORF type:complete len:426 (+),score=154.80 TRINITY_DN1512_c1_g1_i5:1871-3148(+)
MHTSALMGEHIQDARSYGWDVPENVEFSWETLRDNVADHIGSLNFGYRVQLGDHKVDYKNMFAKFVDEHTVEGTKFSKKGKVKKQEQSTARRFLIAVGGRPSAGSFPGADLCVSSDDIFQLDHNPGKVLCVGASYVSLECAGFMNGVGCDTTVMIRSIPLRGFDQQMAQMITCTMADHGVKFLQPAVPDEVVQTDDGRLQVTYTVDGQQQSDVFDTVMLAIGRQAITEPLNLEAAGVITDNKGKIPCVNEQTNVPHIYAVGDVVTGCPELTPVAIQAGKLLSARLFSKSTKMMNYENIATAVFTPVEYGSCGLSEEDAIDRYGFENIEVYHQFFKPLEYSLPHRGDNECYCKVIVDLQDDERILGIHLLSPNAGEAIQAYGLLLSKQCTKEDLDDLIGIHPTIAEEFTTMRITKSSGETPEKSGC